MVALLERPDLSLQDENGDGGDENWGVSRMKDLNRSLQADALE